MTPLLLDLGPLEALRAGRLARRLPQLLVGLVLYGVTIGAMVRAGLGLAPWDVLHSGIARLVPLSLGQVLIAVSVLVLIAWIPLREVPGLGTLLNTLLVGTAADLTLAVLPPATTTAASLGLLAFGVVGNALATALYAGAQFGRGPRDGLMTGLARRTGWSLRLVRTGLEATVVALGLLLGGALGVATIAYAVAIGPLTQLMLPWCAVRLGDPEPGTRTAQRRVAMTADASGAIITSTAVNRSSVSHSSRRVSTRP